MKVNCSHCNIEFNKPASHVKRVNQVFCSKECHDIAQTIYTEKKCEICGSAFKYTGNMKRYSTCSNPICRAIKKQGRNNGMWKGGIAKERNCFDVTAKAKAWKKAVFERDNFTCRSCGIAGDNLHAHHIKPWAFFPELRLDIDNGLTLCMSCHRLTYKEACSYRKRKGGENVGTTIK